MDKYAIQHDIGALRAEKFLSLIRRERFSCGVEFLFSESQKIIFRLKEIYISKFQAKYCITIGGQIKRHSKFIKS